MRMDAAHRPWPPPSEPWIMTMTWRDLLFMHWPMKTDQLRPLLPPGLELETWEGEAWIGVVPFHMTNVRPRFVPPLPWLSAFPELNVRTYVTLEGKPGVWFFSLDATNRLAIAFARRFFHLPYQRANMSVSVEPSTGMVQYESSRREARAAPAAFRGRYRPSGEIEFAKGGTLEHWLTERSCLYAADRQNRIWRCEILHPPWPLQEAEAHLAENTMAAALGLTLPDIPPLLHFARRLDVVAWRIRPL